MCMHLKFKTTKTVSEDPKNCPEINYEMFKCVLLNKKKTSRNINLFLVRLN